MGCNRCKGTSSGPNNFLLCCSGCGKNWHHRCHIPPLSDEELIALLRATNDNNVDNGLSSWTGRCCKRRRVPKRATTETSIRSAPSASVVEVKQSRSPSVSVPPKVRTDADPIHEVSRQGTDPLSDLKHPTRRFNQTIRSSGVATPSKQGDERTTAGLSFNEPAACVESLTTLLQLDLQYPEEARSDATPLPPDTAAKEGQVLRPSPIPSTSSRRFALASPNDGPSRFVPYSRVPHLPESLMALEQTPTSQPVEPTHARVSSQPPKHSLIVEGASHASTKSRSTGVDPPTLDLRALSLNRAGPSKAPSRLLLHRETTSRTATPPAVPPFKPEDDEIEDLYGPPLGLPSPYARTPPQRGRPHAPSPSLQYPEESGALLLPALAAKDPNVLAMLERHEQRQAARPRQGMRKVQAVRGAGTKRRGFVLVENRTKAETALAVGRAVARASQWMATIY